MTDRIKSVVLWVVLALFIAFTGYKCCVQPVHQQNTACDDVQAIMARASDSIELSGYTTVWADSLPDGNPEYVRQRFALSHKHECTVFNDTDLFIEYNFDTLIQRRDETTRTKLSAIKQYTKIAGYWRRTP